MIIKKLGDFISKRPQILKFHIFERYIDFYFKSNFDAVFVFELIEPRGYLYFGHITISRVKYANLKLDAK
jgi:hypothetical protein